MTQERGWIKLHRKITECFIWNDKPFDKARAWIDLLLMASHEDHKTISGNKAVVIEQGSFVTSAYKLADRWGWNRKTVMDYLKLLESENMVATERTAKGTTVTIVNYGKYQLGGTTEWTTNRTTERTTERTTQGLPDYISNNTNINNLTRMDKNGKEYINIYSSSFEEMWSVYPRKREKANAFKQYKARLNDGWSEEELLQAVKNYADECKREHTEAKYIKHGSTFFSASTPFIDYLDKNYKGGAKSGRTGADDRAVEEDPYAKRFRNAARGCLSDMSEHGVENLFD